MSGCRILTADRARWLRKSFVVHSIGALVQGSESITIMPIHLALGRNLRCGLIGLALCTTACQKDSKPASAASSDVAPEPPGPAATDRTSAGQSSASRPFARGTHAAAKTKFQPYEVIDSQQGGLVVSRIAVPAGWKSTSKVVWNYNDFYLPVHVSARTQAPDGSSWIEYFPAEFFIWLDPAHDRGPIGPSSSGIHHPNITLPVAMSRYVIARNRANARNLRLLGYRPVNNLPQVFARLLGKGPKPQGEGICMRVRYELGGSSVDEEFYGFMTTIERLASPNGRIGEFHRVLLMVHSIGAKNGKIESVRPLLGFVSTSIEPNPGWEQRLSAVRKMQTDYYNRQMARNYAGIRAAGERSRALTAQSDQFLKQIDANLAAQRRSQQPSSYSASSNEEFYKRADDFDQNMRGTEHMQDQYGQVSDQYTDYNYHWTDGFGRFVHTDDPNLDPNRYLTGDYQQMTPAPR